MILTQLLRSMEERLSATCKYLMTDDVWLESPERTMEELFFAFLYSGASVPLGYEVRFECIRKFHYTCLSFTLVTNQSLQSGPSDHNRCLHLFHAFHTNFFQGGSKEVVEQIRAASFVDLVSTYASTISYGFV